MRLKNFKQKAKFKLEQIFDLLLSEGNQTDSIGKALLLGLKPLIRLAGSKAVILIDEDPERVYYQLKEGKRHIAELLKTYENELKSEPKDIHNRNDANREDNKSNKDFEPVQ